MNVISISVDYSLYAATILFDVNFQILQFYLRGKDDLGRDRVKSKFADRWKDA